MVDVQQTLRVMLVAMTAALAGTAGLAAIAIKLAGAPDWWTGWKAALIISVLATLFSLALVVPGILAGPQWAAYGYLGGALVRVIAALGGCVAAALVFRVPAVPTFLLIVPMYFSQVASETIVLGRAFWPRG